MKICFLDADTLGKIGLGMLESLGQTSIYGQTHPKDILDRMEGCHVVITNKVVIGKEEMLRNPQLRLICVAATGTNNVDLAAAQELGIAVRNVKGYSTQSVAQVTFSLIFTWLTRIPYFDQYVKGGGYAQSPHFTHFGHEFNQLAGMTMGIIGMGAIGRHVAQIAAVFGCRVVYYSTSGVSRVEAYPSVSLKELLTESDVVSIHAPLNPRTENLISSKELSQMKSSAFLINTGRGGIVNEFDLAKALDNGVISGAAIDVFTQEPIRQDHPLLKLKNPGKIILTPHIAWASVESRTKLLEGVCNNIREVMGKV
ncbi:MAG: D-2-hydroxyacid dehydrogenase [Cytophagales bacterium]|nr:D-2-hydroxyacid dehydrogenase [Cytophagales bacterium]